MQVPDSVKHFYAVYLSLIYAESLYYKAKNPPPPKHWYVTEFVRWLVLVLSAFISVGFLCWMKVNGPFILPALILFHLIAFHQVSIVLYKYRARQLKRQSP
jgi:hypothetical protein